MQAMIGGTSAVSTEMPSDINSGSFKQRMGFFDARQPIIPSQQNSNNKGSHTGGNMFDRATDETSNNELYSMLTDKREKNQLI